MTASRRFAAVASLLLGAATIAHAAALVPTAPAQSSAHRIDHCLLTLGFADVSSENPYPQLLREDPQLVSVWARAGDPLGSDAPHPVASVRRAATEWTVDFVHGHGQGPEASLFSLGLSTCLTVHSRSVDVDLGSRAPGRR